MTGRLFLVDGYALIYRAFFAMLSRPLTTSRGENTSVPWGIVNFLLRLREKHRPDYVAWIHDAGTTFRHEQLPDYKATREKLDAELQQDFDRSLTRVEALLTAFRVPLLAVDGWEADDVIATLADRGVREGLEVIIVSGDKDFYQLIRPGVALLNPGRGGPAAVEEQLVTEANAAERLGVPPDRTVDFLALVGDSADNVPGVHGIGEKTAQKLIAEYGDLETILAHAADVGAKRAREALLAEADRARLSRDLVTLRRDAPVEAPFPALAAQEPNWRALVALLRELEFNSLVHSLAERAAAPVPSAAPEASTAAPEAPAAAGLPGARVAASAADVAQVVAEARRAGAVGLATVRLGEEPVRARLVGLALATGPETAWYLPFAHRAPGEMFADETVRNLPPPGDPALASLDALLRDPRVAKAGHDLKADLLVLRRAGWALEGLAFDDMLASFLLEPGKRSYGMDAVVHEYLGEELRTLRQVAGSGRGERPLDELPVREAADCACAAAAAALRLRDHLGPLLDAHALAPLYRDVEMPLVRVLAAMEWEGVLVDRERFARLAGEFRRELGALEQRIYAAAGTDFNLLSTPQLRHVLFEKLQLPVLKKTKTGASTDAEVLEELAAAGHQVPRLLLEYREIAKLLSTYLEALPQAVDLATGRIHTTFNQIGAATGRLSSNNPNLQNIPVRSARGEDIRRGFIPQAGWRFVVADYSQIELRLLAHLSGDEAFVAAFRAGGDIHRQTAAVIFGVDAADVSADQRARAKTINFATLYGQGPHALSRQLGIARDEAKRFIDAYFERFAGVRRFLDEAVRRAREKGYAETIFGRRRYIPELQDRNFNIRSFGERTATNSPIQGSAADLIKVAMVRVAAALGEGQRARLLLQVHDELVLEAPAGEADRVGAMVKEHMEGAAALTVPLVADVGIGTDWVDAKAG